MEGSNTVRAPILQGGKSVVEYQSFLLMPLASFLDYPIPGHEDAAVAGEGAEAQGDSGGVKSHPKG